MIGLGAFKVINRPEACLMIVPGHIYEIGRRYARLLSADEAEEKGYKSEATLARRMRDEEAQAVPNP